MLDSILGNVDGITSILDVGTELGSLYGPLDGSNDESLWDYLLETH